MHFGQLVQVLLKGICKMEKWMMVWINHFLSYLQPDGTYKAISSPKTVYDPIKFSDHEMLEMGQKAVAKGYSDLLERNRLDPKVYQDSQKINGIKFHYYIDTETKGVTNVHPK